MMFGRKFAIFMSFMIGVIPVIYAQEKLSFSRVELDSLMNPTLLHGGEKILHVDQNVKSVGTISESDSSIVVNFAFTCKKETTIINVRTFCGCISAVYEKHTYKEEEKGNIAIVYQPNNHWGSINEHAYVYTSDSEKFPVAKLTILGEIRENDKWNHLPNTIGDLRLKRKSINLEVPAGGTQVIERIVCANIGKSQLTLSAEGLPEFTKFHVEPAVLNPNQEGDLVMTIDVNKMSSSKTEFCFNILGTNTVNKDQTIKVSIDRNNK